MSMGSKESGGASRSLEFTQWPLYDEPLRSVAVLAFLAACAAGAAWFSGRLWLALVLGPLLALTAWRIWLPVHYDFGPRGITERVLRWNRRLNWRDIGDLEHRGRGLVVYADPDRSALGMLRSVFIRVPPDLAERLRGLADDQWQRARGGPPPTDSSVTPTGSTRTELFAPPAPPTPPARTPDDDQAGA